MPGEDSVPPLSEGVAHAMAVGAEVDVSAGADRRRCAPLFPQQMSPRISARLGGRAVRDVFLPEILARLRGQKLGEMLTAGHHAFESRSVLVAVKARRFAPPARS